MRRSKFTEEQIAFALKQGETGTPVKEVIRKMGTAEQTFYRYRVSQRCACKVFQIQRSSHRYQSTREEQAELRMRIKEIAAVRV
ncbi:MAG: transposase, partial [Thermodesulfobacteriota bacterium]